MSTHTAAMTRIRSASSNSSGFFRRLAGCVIFVVGIAGHFALIQRFQVNLSPPLMSVFAILAVGLAVGSAPRASFYGWPGWIRFLIVLTLLPVGLIALGFFTNWQIGVGPLGPWLEGKIDQEQIVQLCGAFVVAVLSLTAWRKRSPKIEPEALVSRQAINPREVGRTPAPVRTTGSIRLVAGRVSSMPAASRIGNLFPRFKRLSGFGMERTPHTKRSSLSFKNGKSRSGYQRLSRRKPHVQVSLFEVHRCPYCLEEVKPTDPRGVKKCEICNTLHHADCWDVTGECQVPHLNTL